MSNSKRKKREELLANSKANRRFKRHAKQLGLQVLEKIGVNAETVDDAIELLEEARSLFDETGMGFSFSSHETGVYLILCS